MPTSSQHRSMQHYLWSRFSPSRVWPARFRTAGALAVAALSSTLAGCGSRQQAEAPVQPKVTQGPPRVSDADVAKHKPNETGAVMVLMYHRFNADEPDNDLNRKPSSFRKDLEMLHKRGYHPVTALEFVENRMDVPAGKTPVVLTFDDALPSQFRVVQGTDGKSHIDPDCAVGILETFHKKYPDWPTKGTFFVLPNEAPNPDPFKQSEHVSSKLQYLQDKGYEIANHTSTHTSMRNMAVEKIRWELATCKRKITAIQPKAAMETLALPLGKLPRGEAGLKSMVEGKDGGTTYKHKAVFLAAWRPVLSPVTRKDKALAQGGTFCLFDPHRLERIKADAREAKLPGTLEYWLNYFDKNPTQRYISDGNMEVVTVPAAHKSAVDATRVQSQGKTLQVYGGATGGKQGASDLSVQ